MGGRRPFIYIPEPLVGLGVPEANTHAMEKLCRTSLVAILVLSVFRLPAQAPVHFWPLDETNGTTAPDLNGGAHGTLVNGPVWAVGDGYLGNGLEFDGLDDRVDLGPIDITSGTGFSLACWIRPGSSTMQEQLFVGKAYDPLFGDFVWSVGTTLHTRLQFRLQTVSTTTIQTPPNTIFPGAFYHVAITYDGSTMALYVNGALAASAPKSGALGFHPQALAAMGHLDIGPGVVPFEGVLGDVRIWDRGLDQAEIIDLVLEQDISMGTKPVAQTAVPTGPTNVFDLSGRPVAQYEQPPTVEQLGILPPGLYVLVWQAEGRSFSELRGHTFGTKP